MTRTDQTEIKLFPMIAPRQGRELDSSTRSLPVGLACGGNRASFAFYTARICHLQVSPPQASEHQLPSCPSSLLLPILGLQYHFQSSQAPHLFTSNNNIYNQILTLPSMHKHMYVYMYACMYSFIGTFSFQSLTTPNKKKAESNRKKDLLSIPFSTKACGPHYQPGFEPSLWPPQLLSVLQHHYKKP